jgi:hypothetical protein
MADSPAVVTRADPDLPGPAPDPIGPGSRAWQRGGGRRRFDSFVSEPVLSCAGDNLLPESRRLNLAGMPAEQRAKFQFAATGDSSPWYRTQLSRKAILAWLITAGVTPQAFATSSVLWPEAKRTAARLRRGPSPSNHSA